ncbi:MAG: transposase family protein, partial [Actinobacteria bacterium]|nr:transposase family protein [Actinomycetota bacterium]
MVDLILKIRKLRPYWGPRTLRQVLIRQGVPAEDLPAASTIGAILKREGLVRRRARRPRTPPSSSSTTFASADRPNAMWCIDFKGQFRTADGIICYPLTIVDAYSRYLVRCEATATPNEAFVRKVCESAFRELGLPARIRSDNGAPFASVGAGGLTALSAWWVKLGIFVERIEPGKPQQNGRQERFHRTLKAETATPPRSSLRAQQRTFDQFRRRYNEERPHQALGGAVPDELHAPSTRVFGEPVDPTYPPGWDIQRTGNDGSVVLDRHKIALNSALRGELVALRSAGPTRVEVYFGPIVLGYIERFRKPLRLVRPRRKRPDV